MNNSIVKTQTANMIKSLESVQFVSRQQAAELAATAKKEFSFRSKEGKAVATAVFNMVMAGGCPNAVFNAVEKLVDRFVDFDQMRFNNAYQPYNNI